MTENEYFLTIARALGVDALTFRNRVRRGWSPDEAAMTLNVHKAAPDPNMADMAVEMLREGIKVGDVLVALRITRAGLKTLLDSKKLVLTGSGRLLPAPKEAPKKEEPDIPEWGKSNTAEKIARRLAARYPHWKMKSREGASC